MESVKRSVVARSSGEEGKEEQVERRDFYGSESSV